MGPATPPDDVFEVPREVAEDMVQRLFADATPGRDDRILFPGPGSGVLMQCVADYCTARDLPLPESVVIELDEEYLDRLQGQFDDWSPRFLHRDFLAELPAIGTFDYIVGDPPLGRRRDFDPEYRADLAARFATVTSQKPRTEDELYLPFFERGLELLDPNGRLVFVTPDFTDEGGSATVGELKQRLVGLDIESIDDVPVRFPAEVTAPEVILTTVERADPREPASDVDYDGVQDALTGLYEITAADLMTPDPLAFSPDANVHDAYLTLIRRDFDAALVRTDGGECLGFASRADLTGAETGALSDGFIENLAPSQVLSPTAPFETVLDQLRQHRYCLVGTTAAPEGILTRFDLNNIEVYHHLYARLARFEIGLRKEIRARGIAWDEALLDGGVSASRIRGIERRYEEQSGSTQDILDTILLSDLLKIAQQSSIEAELGVDAFPPGVYLSDINDLRGAVAHYQPLIHTLDTLSLTGQRTTGDFADTYDALTECLERLGTTEFS